MIAATILPLIAAGRRPGAGDRAGLDAGPASSAAIMILGRRRAGSGFIADLLSKPTQIGYMNGLALTILVGQLPKLFGFSVDADGLIAEARGFVEGLADGKAVPAAVGDRRGRASSLILVLQRWLPQGPGRARRGRAGDRPRPASSTSATTASRWSACCPQGFPPLTIPDVRLVRPAAAARAARSGSRWSR